MTNLISVIVPVYNAEKYLERCINSICNQTYKNLEIILVNDGSSDNSKEISKTFVRNDSRVKLINQLNGGSSIARNTGLENATGDIISFVDSDDFIDETMLSEMHELMVIHNLDVVEIERNAELSTTVFDHSFTIENQLSAIERIIKTTAFQVWKRLYKRSVVENMRFIPNIIHQDVFFTIDIINKTESIGFLNTPLYNYNRESIGIIRSKYSVMKRDIAIRATEYIKNNIPKNYKLNKVMDAYIVNYYSDHYLLLSRNLVFDTKRYYRKKLKKEIFKSLNKSNLNIRSLLILVLPVIVIEKISFIYLSLKSN
jgi:glycosyltransferase involved in cell wall biosynthesis